MKNSMYSKLEFYKIQGIIDMKMKIGGIDLKFEEMFGDEFEQNIKFKNKVNRKENSKIEPTDFGDESTIKEEQETLSNQPEPNTKQPQKDVFKDKYIRLLADFDNYKKRTIEENEKFEKQAVSNFVEELIPVLDSFNVAINILDENDSSTQGVFMIYDKMKETLLNNGLVIVKDTNVEFNPNIHHAVMMEEREDIESGNVVEVMQCGYVLNGKLIKPALVKVAK